MTYITWLLKNKFTVTEIQYSDDGWYYVGACRNDIGGVSAAGQDLNEALQLLKQNASSIMPVWEK
jgi:predicted RNase H-like HicB family nuclease